MNKYLKNFLLRGMAFSSLGPIISGIVYLILSLTIEDFSLSGSEVFLAIISTYFLAFIQAGASVFNQIDSWSVPKSLSVHFSLLYVAYVICYIINTWIPFEWTVIAIFTAIFVAAYLAIWLTVYLIVRKTSKDFNRKIA